MIRKFGTITGLTRQPTGFDVGMKEPDGNAIAGDLLSGKTASTSNGDIVGTMTNKVGSATVITPSTSDKTIPQGYYGGVVGDGKVLGDSNLISTNITTGNTIFNVSGIALKPTITANQNASGIVFIDTTTYTTTSQTPVKLGKRYTSKIQGTISIRTDCIVDSGTTAYFQPYKNGVAVGTLHSSTRTASGTYLWDDIVISPSDYIDIYVYSSAGGALKAQLVNNAISLTVTVPTAQYGTLA